jgi:hypothetical protein
MDKNNNQQPQSILKDYLDRLTESAGTNRDTEGLGTMAVGPLIIGSVDAINGEDGREIPEFVATRHELKRLADYWAKQRIEHNFDWFLYHSSGSSEWRWSTYIDHRLTRLTEVLGQEAMRRVQDDVIVSFRKRYPKITDEDWKGFTAGSDEEDQETLRKKVFGEEEEMQGEEQL